MNKNCFKNIDKCFNINIYLICRNLLECLLDASKLKEAKEFSSTAAVFIKENAPDKYSQIFSLMVML